MFLINLLQPSCSERKERAVFRELLRLVPSLEDRLMSSSEEEVSAIADLVWLTNRLTHTSSADYE